MSAAHPTAPSNKTIATHVALPLLMGLAMALCYLGGFHKPDPHDVRVDVIGTGTQVSAAAQRLQDGTGEHLSVRTTPTAAGAKQSIEHRDIAAAFDPSGSTAVLYVSTAAGDPAAVVMERIFGDITIAQDQPLRIVDVVPADPEHDPSGQSLFFLLVALTVGSYGTGIAIAVAAGGRSMRTRIGFAAGAAVITSALATFVAAVVIDALPGSPWPILALAIPYAFTTMLFAVGLHPLIGRFTTLTMVTLFVGLNFTTSGGVFPPSLQPGFFAALHNFWIGAGFNEAARNISYFPQVPIAGDLAKIFGWLVVAVALVGVSVAVERRRAAAVPTPDSTPPEPQGRHARRDVSDEQLEELEEDVVA